MLFVNVYLLTIFISFILTSIYSNGGNLAANFMKGLTFVQRYGNDLSNIASAVLIFIPLLFAIPTRIFSRTANLKSESRYLLFFKKIRKSLNFVEDLSNSDIITIDGAVIAGALILLTLSGLNRSQINTMTANIVFPFAVSAVTALFNSPNLGIKLMVAGFINLMISIMLLSIVGSSNTT